MQFLKFGSCLPAYPFYIGYLVVLRWKPTSLLQGDDDEPEGLIRIWRIFKSVGCGDASTFSTCQAMRKSRKAQKAQKAQLPMPLFMREPKPF